MAGFLFVYLGMKVKLLKDHLNDKAGDVIETEDGIGEYLIKMCVGEKPKEKKDKKSE